MRDPRIGRGFRRIGGLGVLPHLLVAAARQMVAATGLSIRVSAGMVVSAVMSVVVMATAAAAMDMVTVGEVIPMVVLVVTVAVTATRMAQAMRLAAVEVVVEPRTGHLSLSGAVAAAVTSARPRASAIAPARMQPSKSA